MLISSQTAVKGGHGLEIAVSMNNLRGGDWGEILNNGIVFEVCTRNQARTFSVVFMSLISATQKFKLEKSTLNTKE